MRLLLIGAGMAALVLAAPAQAQIKQGGLTIDFNLRGRMETIDGQFRPNIASGDTVMLLRTGLAATYDAGPITLGGELRDSRVYFEKARSSVSASDVNTFEPIQAYVTGRLGGGASLTAGRFTMALGSQRLISDPGFRNTTNAFTGARFDWKSAGGDSVTAFWTMPQTRLPGDLADIEDNVAHIDRERAGLQLFGASATAAHILGGTLEAYVYRLAEDDSPVQQTKNRHLWTPGLRLYHAPGKGQVDWDLEGMWQTGRTRAKTAASDITDLDVSAWSAHSSLGYTVAAPWQPRFILAFDYASGDHKGGRYGHFDKLYGAGGFEFGPTSFYGPISRANLVSLEARVEVKPNARWDGYVAVRPAWLDSATDSFGSTGVKDAAGDAGRYAGTQIDLRARYWAVPKRLRINAGFALLAKGRFLEDAANAPDTGDTHYGYIEAQFSY